MRRLKSAHVLLALLLVGALAPLGAAMAGPDAQSGGNLLTSGGFEAAGGWTEWWVPRDANMMVFGFGIKPTYSRSSESGRVREGSFSQSWRHEFATAAAGVYQTVTVPANATLHFEAYGMGYSCNPPAGVNCPGTSTLNPTSLHLQIGIDPFGGTDFFAPGVIKSGSQSAFDDFRQFQVNVSPGGSTQVTVFLAYDPDFPVSVNQAWWDSVSLTVTSGGRPTPTQIPSETTVTPETATPDTSGETYTVVRGDWLAKIAAAHGTTVGALVNLNGPTYPSLYSDPGIIQPGWVLKLPAPTTTTADTTPTATPTATATPSGNEGEDTTTTTGGLSASGETYTVQPGDYLIKIAREVGATVPQLIALNTDTYPTLASDPSTIRVGWVLKVPAVG